MAESALATPSEISIRATRNHYEVTHEGTRYDVFEYLQYDAPGEPSRKRRVVYLTEEAEELLDKELEGVILGLIDTR